MIIIKILGAVLGGFILAAIITDVADTIEDKDNPNKED